jgi:hypothetical protein
LLERYVMAGHGERLTESRRWPLPTCWLSDRGPMRRQGRRQFADVVKKDAGPGVLDGVRSDTPEKALREVVV